MIRVDRAGVMAACALVVVLAAVNFLARLGEPRAAIWDESYYLTSTQRYLEGTAQFASHPPLGLMLIAAGARLAGSPAQTETSHRIGLDKRVEGNDLPPEFSFFGVRIASALSGVACAVLFFLLMHALTNRVVPALLYSNLFLFENAFVVQFRAAHLDGFLIAFTVAALLCFVHAIKRAGRTAKAWEFGLGVCCGLACMVKLSGAVLVLLGVLLAARAAWRGRNDATWPRAVSAALRMSAGFLFAVAATFAINTALATQPPDPQGQAGRQDDAFVSPVSRAYLLGERPLSPAVVLAAMDDYRRFVAADYQGMARYDRNGSFAWQWPWHEKTINYRWDSDGSGTRYVQLAGNLAGWMSALMALAGAVCLLALRLLRPMARSPREQDSWLLPSLLAVYAAFMAMHGYLGLHRVMYLYHYFIGLTLCFAMAPLVVAETERRWPALFARRGAMAVAMSGSLLLCFLFYSPLTYHRRLSADACELRNAVAQVVDCVH